MEREMTAEAAPETTAKPVPRTRRGYELIYRHALWVRLAHWFNLLCVVLLLMSGMQIFNAHPRLYWGIKGAESDPAIFSIYAEERDVGPPLGWVQIGKHTFETTGVLGVFTDVDGYLSERGFPYWATIPSYQSLAEGRRWHFFFAWLFALNGLGYLIYGFVSRHFQRDLAPSGRDLRNIGRSILDHLTFKHARGEDAKRYNVLQKFAYMAIVFLVLPLMIVTGLTMSPGVDSAAPWLPELFGGRQSARTLHFLAATAIVLFAVVHLLEVFLSGFFNEMRSMITGWFAVRPEIERKRNEP
jgi:thiosulfate reductase cytochrome b subunit